MCIELARDQQDLRMNMEKFEAAQQIWMETSTKLRREIAESCQREAGLQKALTQAQAQAASLAAKVDTLDAALERANSAGLGEAEVTKRWRIDVEQMQHQIQEEVSKRVAAEERESEMADA